MISNKNSKKSKKKAAKKTTYGQITALTFLSIDLDVFDIQFSSSLPNLDADPDFFGIFEKKNTQHYKPHAPSPEYQDPACVAFLQQYSELVITPWVRF